MTTSKAKKTTTQRGLGYEHRRNRARLLSVHVDGTPCPCDWNECGPSCPCRAAGRGLPMYRLPSLNPDGMSLEADHEQARALGGTKANRLLLATCNRSRGTGERGRRVVRPGPLPHWSRPWFGRALPIVNDQGGGPSS